MAIIQSAAERILKEKSLALKTKAMRPSPDVPQDPPERKFNNVPRGCFLLILRQFDKSSWRVQLATDPSSNRGKTPKFNIRHWTVGNIPLGGLEHGFPLKPKEAEKLIKALQEGLRRIESGEFDPDKAAAATKDGPTNYAPELSPEEPGSPSLNDYDDD
jgi:hypothetical protein